MLSRIEPSGHEHSCAWRKARCLAESLICSRSAVLYAQSFVFRSGSTAPTWVGSSAIALCCSPTFGRISKLPRHAVLEVLRHDRTTDTDIIASAWGEQADWFQNIQKTPEVVLRAGVRRLDATTERLSVLEAERELRRYARRHPLIYRWGFPAVFGCSPKTAADWRALAESLPLVAVQPTWHRWSNLTRRQANIAHLVAP